MKKHVLAAGMALFAALACSCACKAPEEPEKEPPAEEKAAPLYTVSEEHLSEDANGARFSAAAVTPRENSPLKGKLIYWLGSSVTYGASSQGESMAEFLSALTGCECVKEAVSGTTIFDDGLTADTGEKSYTRRLINGTALGKDRRPDIFICQISTNDCTNSRLAKRGEMLGGVPEYLEDCDRATTLGGVEYIIKYALDTWGCPVYFYSGAYFGDEGSRANSNPKGSEYAKLVSQVKEIAQKWYDDGYEVGVIDMYNDRDFNDAVTDGYYRWCTSDPIHPKKAGYLNWWTPYIEAFLLSRPL